MTISRVDVLVRLVDKQAASRAGYFTSSPL